jgi:hypothetical protein
VLSPAGTVFGVNSSSVGAGVQGADISFVSRVIDQMKWFFTARLWENLGARIPCEGVRPNGASWTV